MLRRVLPAFSEQGKRPDLRPDARGTEKPVGWYILLTMSLVVFSALLHYEAMQWAALKLLPRIHFLPTRSLVIVGVLVCMAAHQIEVLLFAAVLYLLAGYGLDLGYDDQQRRTFLDFVNSSIESYTSLGYGDTEHLTQVHRMVSGAEALTGLVLIAWTASFTYLLMEKYWRERHGRR
jgi:hypothetical protein